MATKAELEKENKKLMAKVRKLEKHIEKLEDLIEEKLFLSWKELQTIKKDIKRLSERIQMLDMNNPFERREIYSLTTQLRSIHNSLENQQKCDNKYNGLRLIK